MLALPDDSELLGRYGFSGWSKQGSKLTNKTLLYIFRTSLRDYCSRMSAHESFRAEFESQSDCRSLISLRRKFLFGEDTRFDLAPLGKEEIYVC